MLQIRPPGNPLNLQTQKCTLGCPILDGFLGGGIPCGSITELVSESGAGKTQLCLQLLLANLAASLYIHSEFPFPIRRLSNLTLSFPSSTPSPLDHIFVRPVHSAEELLSLLDRLEPLLARPPSHLPVKLLVIDSIAALFRSDFDNNPGDLKRRSSLFFKIAGRLKEKASRFGLAVVVTNQVVDVVVGPEDGGVGGLRIGNLGCLWSSGRRVRPALGLSWANCVNTRLFLSRWDERMGSEMGLERVRTRRKMQVVFAPHLPESSCEFVISKDGASGVSL